MFCSKCGKELRIDDVFCSSCGTRVIKEIIKQEKNATKQEERPKSQYQSLLFKSILGAVAICALLEIIFILSGALWEVHTKVLSSAAWIMFYGVIAYIAVGYHEKTKYKNLGMAFILLTAINFITSTLITWNVINFENEMIIKLVLTFWIIFSGIIHSILLSLIKFKNDNVKSIFNITNIIISITYFIGILKFVFDINSEFYTRLFWVFVILTLFASVGTALVNKISKADNNYIENTENPKKPKNKIWIIILVIIFAPSLLSGVSYAIIKVSNLNKEDYDNQNNIYRPKPDNDSEYFKETHNVCKGEKIPLSNNMITHMSNYSYFSDNIEELHIFERYFDLGLILKEGYGSDVVINTTGCKKVKGTVVFDNAGQDIETIEFVILKDGYNGVKLEYFNINNGDGVDFETNITGANQIMIRRLHNVIYDNTKVVVGDIYFE